MRALVLVLGMSGAALADAPDCANAVTQSDLNLCAERAWRLADTDLNLAYRQAMASYKAMDADLPEDGKGAVAALKLAQRNWIAFRDSACAAEGWQYRGGSIAPMIVDLCLERLTRARTEDLRQIGETN